VKGQKVIGVTGKAARSSFGNLWEKREKGLHGMGSQGKVNPGLGATVKMPQEKKLTGGSIQPSQKKTFSLCMRRNVLPPLPQVVKTGRDGPPQRAPQYNPRQGEKLGFFKENAQNTVNRATLTERNVRNGNRGTQRQPKSTKKKGTYFLLFGSGG